ncbi:MAG: hypothetical protein ACK5N8_00485 [Alphaproteobacteria bacterium]
MNAIILTATQSYMVDLDEFMVSLASSLFFIVALALFCYAIYILCKSTNVLSMKIPKPRIYETTFSKKEENNYEEKLQSPIEHNKVFSVLSLIIFLLCVLIVEKVDLLEELITAKFVIFSAFIFINFCLAFADKFFEIAKENRRFIVMISGISISVILLIAIVLNATHYIVVRMSVLLALIIFNVINIYKLTKKSTSD